MQHLPVFQPENAQSKHSLITSDRRERFILFLSHQSIYQEDTKRNTTDNSYVTTPQKRGGVM